MWHTFSCIQSHFLLHFAQAGSGVQYSSLITGHIWGTLEAAGGICIPPFYEELTQLWRADLRSDIAGVSALCMCFLQNGNNDNPNCVGIEEVLEAYFQSLRKVQLYGPTNFAPVINQVAR